MEVFLLLFAEKDDPLVDLLDGPIVLNVESMFGLLVQWSERGRVRGI